MNTIRNEARASALGIIHQIRYLSGTLKNAYIPDMNTEFEWEPEKAESNSQKHGVSFAEAATVFFDPLSITVPDPLHSVTENRFVITALSYQQRHLVVVHTDRGDRIRLISARLATPAERKKYESGIE
jgi:uncharacterized DUF497 family protein